MPQGWTVPRKKIIRLSCRLQVKLLWPGLLKWRAIGLSESLRLTESISISQSPARFSDVKHQAFAAGKAANIIGRLANDINTDGKIEFRS